MKPITVRNWLDYYRQRYCNI